MPNTKDYGKASRLKNKEYISRYLLEHKDDKKRYNKEYQKKNRDKLWEFKKNSCKDCGLVFHPCQMDFDHLNPLTKTSNVGALVHNTEKMLEEISKCDLICSNCHRLRTYNRGK